MKQIQFKCTLLSDIIINQKAATEGNQESLDFIPGGNFLGIAASTLYQTLNQEDAYTLFHSGKIRFGDAHPLINGMRSLRIPASLFSPKNKSDKVYYIHHHIIDHQAVKNKQLKQSRSGFYAFDKNKAEKIEVLKSFSIKSAYDREKRRSEDEKMYGYQSIDKGLVFGFAVELDDDDPRFEELIIKALVGNKRVGRSKSAQYGLVKIEEATYNETSSTLMKNNDLVAVYADSRLIFMDDYGQLTFQPKAKDLGFEDSAEIVWSKTQIRTFQYAPWNSTRKSRDADRCGIEKGSVFVVKTNLHKAQSEYVGLYKSEGFGKVIYNPDFLLSIPDSNGKAIYEIMDTEKGEEQRSESKTEAELDNNLLIAYLKRKQIESDMNNIIYKEVNDFVEQNKNKFVKDLFASQWGTIRKIAMQSKTKEDLKDRLFNKPKGYLTHGIALEKWNEQNRIESLMKFIREFKEKSDQWTILAVINLASAMAKTCKK